MNPVRIFEKKNCFFKKSLLAVQFIQLQYQPRNAKQFRSTFTDENMFGQRTNIGPRRFINHRLFVLFNAEYQVYAVLYF